eukprot:m.142352 g.142352  ORF g.142352 m.142352 type:complete len:150 (-) comp17676_c0_seq1:787-1236(-)
MVGVPCDVVSGCWRQARVREDFLHFVDAVILVQDKPSGRWHQVLNDTDTYLETSATAMIVAAVSKGLLYGWLPRTSTYVDVVRSGWAGLSSQIHANGTVDGISMGTPIEPNASGYNSRGTDFMQSCSGGVGAILHAAKAFHDVRDRFGD